MEQEHDDDDDRIESGMEVDEPDDTRATGMVARSGRSVTFPAWMNDLVAATGIDDAPSRADKFEMMLTPAKSHYCDCVITAPYQIESEYCFLGISGVGGPSKHTDCADLALVSLGSENGFENTKRTSSNEI